MEWSTRLPVTEEITSSSLVRVALGLDITTIRVQPENLSVETWRAVVKNNRGFHINFELESDETWLPKILSEAGFFPSNSEVRKNRKDLWRDREYIDVVKLKWATIKVFPLDNFDNRDNR